MDQEIYFSIVMPAYNCADTVESTIKSIQNQTFKNFELIIVNDGSTDNTKIVLEEIAKSDPRISFYTIPNNGPGNARNIGISHAKGKYLFLVDADDGLPQGTLEKYSTLLAEDIDLIVSSYELNVLDGQEVVDSKKVQVADQRIETHDDFLTHLYSLMNQQLMYVVWNKIYRLDIVKENKIQFPPYKSCEDRLFNIAYFHHVQSCLIMNDIMYSYTFDGKNSLTNKFLENKFETFEEFYIKSLNLTDKNFAGTSALFLKGVMSCIIPIHSSGCPYSTNEKKEYIKDILTNSNVRSAANASAVNTPIRKVMKFLFLSKSVRLNLFASKVMFLLSNMSPKLIEKLKGNF